MRKQETYWTPKRLIELRVKARSMNTAQLCEHFQRSDDDILNALKYEQQKRRLLSGTKVELINGKKVTITVFAAEYAENARGKSSIWDSFRYL